MPYSSSQHLFNTSWTLQRLSPLYHGKEYQTILGNADALKTYAKRLQDLLTGDVLGGVQVGLSGSIPSDDALARAGSLTDCQWETIRSLSHEQGELQEEEEPTSLKDTMGILVTLEYESITYKAALLARPDGYLEENRENDSTYLPLLLTRMPSSLKQTFTAFLSTTFDTYCSLLRLPSSFLCFTLESYMASLLAIDNGDDDGSLHAMASRSVLQSIMRETQLTIAFSSTIAPALKAIDVHLPRETLATFAVDGAKNTIAASDDDQPVSSPFLNSLSQYFDRHLAMKIDLNQSWIPANEQQHVRLSKISCSAFALSADGRVKLNSKDSTTDDGNDVEKTNMNRMALRANEDVLRALVRRAIGEDLRPFDLT